MWQPKLTDLRSVYIPITKAYLAITTFHNIGVNYRSVYISITKAYLAITTFHNIGVNLPYDAS